ncbi:hypothetical protein EYF80_041153 [Liparis tanakae]|uniref:Uncharacterized protein n=1 Tax=Liparis tanakae TaxID=230148 RepID=A0A4Z2G687_9TELE|nr:hypothetical protein EYF80_041153 [Liparis tanakae]
MNHSAIVQPRPRLLPPDPFLKPLAETRLC